MTASMFEVEGFNGQRGFEGRLALAGLLAKVPSVFRRCFHFIDRSVNCRSICVFGELCEILAFDLVFCKSPISLMSVHVKRAFQGF